MKKVSLLLVMLLALVAPSAIAQQVLRPIKGMHERPAFNLDGLQVMNIHANANRDVLTHTVNNGTSTNSNVPIPGNSIANYVETQFVFPAESLTEMVPEGYYAKITGLSFAASTNSVSWGDAEFCVLMQEINYDPDDPGFWYDEDAMTIVYQGGLSISKKAMSFVFNLVDDGFDYFGGDLLICFYNYTTGTNATSNWYGVNSSNPYAAYWNGSNGYLSGFCPKTTITYTQEVAGCVIPGNLAVANITKTSADLSWTERGQSEAWQVSYSTEDDPDNGTIIDVNSESYSFTNLEEGVTYYVYVRAICNEGPTDWSEGVTFTTHTTCEMPTNLQTSNIGAESADLSWIGYADAYDLRYRIYAEHNTNDFTQVGNDVTTESEFSAYAFELNEYSGQQGYIAVRHYNVSDMFLLDIQSIVVKDANGEVVLEADFSNGTGIPDGWHNIDKDEDGHKWMNGGVFVYSESYDNDNGVALHPDNWLVTPMVDLGGTVYVIAKGQDPNYCEEVFGVFVSTTELVEDEWNIVEDIARANYTLDNLVMGDTYEVQVTANCADPDWSDKVVFTTVSILFNRDGNWNEANNWLLGEVPAAGSNVYIAANCIIPAGYLAEAGRVTIQEGGSLTIQDGGQLIHTNTGVVAIMEKEIKGYTGDKDSYYLISTPVTQLVYGDYYLTFPEEVGIVTTESDYDFYQFDGSQVGEEWQNYKAQSFYYMFPGIGYLYANSENVTLSFEGELNPFASTYAYNGYLLDYDESMPFGTFNLVGNMFAADGYIVIADYDEGITGLANDVYFYTMGDGELVAGTGAVAPMEAVMVQASSDSQAALCFTQPLRSNSALSMSLSNNGALVDAAYIRFNEGSELSKFQLNPNHTKLFFTKDNKDFAVVYSNGQNEMPVSFKAQNDGIYTISFSNENVEFGYLHLIDNMTGNDVDLLQTPSYTFQAKTTDYVSRFRLVFSADSANDDIFAYYNNGSFVINNEGNATLQVIDMMGRTISTETINGNANLNINAANGVYMLRLVNGDSVKVQKVVVK